MNYDSALIFNDFILELLEYGGHNLRFELIVN